MRAFEALTQLYFCNYGILEPGIAKQHCNQHSMAIHLIDHDTFPANIKASNVQIQVRNFT